MKNIKMLLSGLVLVMSMSLVGCTDSTNNTGRDVNVPKSEEQLNKEKEEKIYAAYSYMYDENLDVTFADVIESQTNGDPSKIISECDGNKVTISFDNIDGKPYGYVFTFVVDNNKAKLDGIKFVDESGNEEVFDKDRIDWELNLFYEVASGYIMENEMDNSQNNDEVTENNKISIVDFCNKLNSQNSNSNLKISYYEKTNCILVKYILQGTSWQDVLSMKETMGEQNYKQFMLNSLKSNNDAQQVQNIKNEIYNTTGVNVGIEVQVVPEMNQTMLVALYRQSTGWMIM